ncbi:MAG: InlB B-repeat-containing protein, partial [Bacteroidales bacterium]|nr:InlB B-repeat-containing protein [Bacteroidales bacterium]
MKKLKMFMLSALLCAGAFFTASCGDDDDDNPVPNNGTENPSGGNGNGTENPSGGNGSGTETPTTTPTYTVTFDTDGGTTINAQIVDKDGKVTKPADPTKDGYNFKGWNNGTAPYDFSASVTSDLTLKAIWEKLKESYTVTFDSDGGTAINAQIVDK